MAQEFRLQLAPPTGGINLRDQAHALRENEYQVLNNVDPREARGGWKTRHGFSTLSSGTPTSGTAVGSLEYIENVPAGSSFFVWGAQESSAGVLKRTETGGGTTDIAGSFDNDADWYFTVYDNKLYAVNGQDAPQRYDGTTIRNAGYPAPTVVSMTAAGGGTSGALVASGVYQYKVTFVYDDATEESSMSTDDVDYTLSGTDTAIVLSSIPTGGTGCTDRNIYRTVDGGAVYFFVAAIGDNSTTTYTDLIADGSLGDQGPNDNGIPPSGVQFIEVHKERLWMASGSTVYFSAALSSESAPVGNELTQSTSVHGADQEHFPADFYIVVGRGDGDVITGLKSFQDVLYVFKSRSIYAIYGDNSSNFRLVKVHAGQGCAAQRTIVNVENRVFFLSGGSRPGVYSFDGSIPTPLSLKIEPVFRDEFVFADFNLAHAVRLGHMYLLAYRTSSGASGACDKILVYDYTLNAWFTWIIGGTDHVDFTTADGLDGAWYVLNDSAGIIYKFDPAIVGTDPGGAEIDVRIQTRLYSPGGQAESESEIRKVYANFDDPAVNTYVSVRPLANLAAAPTFDANIHRKLLDTNTQPNPYRNDLWRHSWTFPQDDDSQGNYVGLDIDNSSAGAPQDAFNIRDIVIYGIVKAPREETQVS